MSYTPSQDQGLAGPFVAASGGQLDDLVVRRTFWLLSGMVLVTMLPYVAWWATIGAHLALVLCLSVQAVAVFSSWRVHRDPMASARAHLHVLVAVLYLLLGFSAWVQGGMQAPALRWLSVLPFVALMAGLSRLGAALCVAFVAQTAWMAVSPPPDWPQVHQQLLPSPERQFLSSSIGSILFVALLGWLTMRWRRDAYKALDIARARASEGEANKERFLATMSHEIRTPLNGIVGVSSMLKNPTLADAERQRLTRLMDQSARTLLDTLNNVLDWTKMSHGSMPLAAEPLAMQDLIQETINLFAPICQAKGLALLGDVDPDVPATVKGDKLRLQQMLNNLLSNATKFTGQGQIQIKVQRDPARTAASEADPADKVWLALSVQDTGIGIAAHKLSELFQPFNQLDASIAPRFGGTGLGLSIVQGLARAMGGDVAVHSQAEQGTRFTLHLPFGTAIEAQQHATPRPRARTGQTRVLVAEDNELNQWIIQEMLTHCEAEAHFVSTGNAALEVLEKDAFDLLLIDQNMPGLDGLSTVARIRAREARHHLARLPTVLISGDARLGGEAAAQGVDACLFKPFEFAALRDTLRLARKEGAQATVEA